MSMEISKKETIESDNPVNRDAEKVKAEDEDDYLVKTIGAFGLWQAVVSVTVSLTRVIASWNLMSLSFLIIIPEFVCVEFRGKIPTEVKNSTCFDHCLKYKYSSELGPSIIEDFGLICEHAWLASFTQSVLMLGALVGLYFFGWMSDRFGRRKALRLSTLLNAVFMIALPFSPTYFIFTLIRFMIGVASGGSLVICVTHIMEIIGKQYREIAGTYCLIPDSIAEASLAGFAYFTSDWRGYTLSYGVVTCFIFILILFVPESPRWLVANGKIDESITVITRAANRNKIDTSFIKDEVTKALNGMKLMDCKNIELSYTDFFKTKKLFIQTLTVFILWIVLGLCFYGVYLYVTIIGVNPYLTVVILGLIQIPVCPVTVIVTKTFGRKVSTMGTITGVAIVMLIIIFIPNGYGLKTVLGALAFIFSNISFTIAYIYVSELYPTPLRNMSYGLASSGAKIGAMAAPFLANMSPSWLPSLLFCIFPIVGGLCCLLLPETKGQNLSDRLEK